jgi:voltage-gated potassium channel
MRSAYWPSLGSIPSNGLATIGLLAMILNTAPAATTAQRLLFSSTVIAVSAAMTAMLAFHLWTVPGWRKRLRYIASTEGMIDLASACALPFGWLIMPDPQDALLFALIWALRYIRHASGLALFWRVMHRSRTALLSILSLFIAIFFVASSLAYIFERHAQPDAFGSIPRAMWWAIVTMTTTGYGDMLPVTIWGRLLAGWVMVGGVVMFALQAGIIAAAFAAELQRRHFLHIWDLVTRVPLFQKLGAATIADIVRRLEMRDVSKGAVIVRRGEPGDTMYFFVSGEAAVLLDSTTITLNPGSFFGEMALLFGAPRAATVVATKPSVLLVLDVADLRELAARRPELVNLIEAEARRRKDANATGQTPPSPPSKGTPREFAAAPTPD